MKSPLVYIDNLLNTITMYRLVLYGLFVLFCFSLVFSVFGLVSYSLSALVLSFLVLLLACLVANYTCARIWNAPRNIESAYITALILFFILAPSTQVHDIGILALASLLAMLSKYVLAIGKKHVFNPAAIALVILAFCGSGAVFWWVATPWMALPVAVIGFLIVRKIRRPEMFVSFVLTSLVVIIVTQYFSASSTSFSGSSVWSLVSQVFLSWPLLFVGTIMLTEPLTTPPTKRLQIAYALIVGFFFAFQFHVGFVYTTPALALVIGNIFSYIVSPKQKLKLTFVSKQKLSAFVYDFSFSIEKGKKVSFQPGQYMEWTLEHSYPDTRGNRRYFTIASSPSEPLIHLGVRVDPEHSSSFKKALYGLQEGGTLMASGLSGEFVMPQDASQKLVFIAGGVGITPFRSMIRYLSDRNEHRDIVLFYACSTPADFAYQEEIEEAKSRIGMKTIYIASNTMGTNFQGRTGFISADIIAEEVSDSAERAFYLSGPNAMVENYKKMLMKMGIARKNIHTDYFPGF